MWSPEKWLGQLFHLHASGGTFTWRRQVCQTGHTYTPLIQTIKFGHLSQTLTKRVSIHVDLTASALSLVTSHLLKLLLLKAQTMR